MPRLLLRGDRMSQAVVCDQRSQPRALIRLVQALIRHWDETHDRTRAETA